MYKCKICKKSFTELQGLYNHIERKHSHMIPKNMGVEQYYYYMKTGKSNGNCVICKQPTTWNKNTNKYNRFCDNPKCKEKYTEEFRKRMIGKYGKVHLLNDPEKQREMLANRSISGKYRWDNGTETVYTGSYEHDFLKMMDGFFDWDPDDIMMPSPHNYVYKYNGEDKYYIPDVFIPSLNLEIEIKDGGDNPNMHYKIQDVDKVKEKNKDDVMISQKSFHYIKITNKNYTNFFNFLKEIKDQFEKHGDENKIPRIFKIEDIKAGTSAKVVKESNEFEDEMMLESGYLTFADIWDNVSNNITNGKVNEIIKKVDKINVRDLDKINNMYIDHADSKEGFEAIRNHSITLMKKSKSKDDVMYVEGLVRKIGHKLNDEYQKGKIDKNDVIEFKNWLNKDFNKELKKKKEKYLSESFILTESENNIQKLFFLSEKNMCGEILQPRIPKNFFTENGYEDKETKRVCFSSSIDGCLMGISMNCKDKYFYVHVPIEANLDIITPTIKQVPDSKLTKEKWVTKPVKIKCIGKIHVVSDDGKPGKEFKYGDNKKAKLYGWKWEYDKNSTLTESSISYQQLNFALQANTDERIKEYMKSYADYYEIMMRERPDASENINNDVNKAVKYINDLKRNNCVNKKLADMAIREFKNYGYRKKYISESNQDCTEEIYLYMVFDPDKKRQLFTLNDSDSKLFIGDGNYISREKGDIYHLNGAGACSIHKSNLCDELKGKRVIKHRVITDSPICLDTIVEVLRNDKYIRLNSLYKINDNRDTFMDDVRAAFKRHCDVDVDSIVQISDEIYDEKGCVVDGSGKIE